MGQLTLLNLGHLVVLLAGSISHTSIQYIDFVESAMLHFSTIYFSGLSGCRASFLSGCYSILECYNLFSGVKFSIRSFCFTCKRATILP